MSDTPAEQYYAEMEASWAGYPSTDTEADYEAFFAEMGADRTMRSLIAELLEHVERDSGRLLEVGCDNGILLSMIEGWDRHGVDLNRRSIERGRTLFPELTLVVGDGVTVPYPDGHFDAVLLSAVLKHIRHEDRPAFYDELARVGAFVLVCYEDKPAGDERCGPFTFYRGDFAAELSARFAHRHTVRCGGYVFSVYAPG